MIATEHNPSAAPDYLTTLGLQLAPYLESADTRFFYADPSLVQRLDLLQHLTQFGDMLLGVTGPIGSGKSILAQQFLQRANTAWRTCHLNGAQSHQPDELLTKLAECFGLLSATTPEHIKTELLRHCQTLRHNAQLAVLVIDDAHLLPDPVLKALLQLADEPRETLKLLRVILFSEPGLEQRLAALGWHSPLQPLLHNLEIPHFDEQQTAAYLLYRLAVAGYSGESPFSVTEIRALHKATDGVPGRLNVLAHETLIEHAGRMAARKKTGASGNRRTRPAMILGLLGSLAAGVFAWYMSLHHTDQKPLDTVAFAPVEPAPVTRPAGVTPVLPTAAPTPPSEEPAKSLEATPEIQQPTDKNNINERKSGEPAPAEAPAIPSANGTPAGTPDSRPRADTAQPKSAPATPPDSSAAPPVEIPTTNTPAPVPAAATPAPANQTPAILAAATQTPAKPVAESDTATQTTPAPAQKPQPTEASAPVASPVTPNAEPVAVADPAPPPTQTAATRPTPPPVTATAAGGLGADWLQSRPRSHFTLQLLGGRSEKSLREFLRQHRIPEPVATFHTIHKGGDWYVLVHGEFPSMAAAQQAVATLPQAVRRGKPWPRSFASVHDAIRE